MSDALCTVDPQSLRELCRALFLSVNMSEKDAEYCTDCLLTTNLWGVDSHGVLRLPIYIQRLQSRAVNPAPACKVVRGMGAIVSMDGDDGMGYVAGREAMDKAIELARLHGMGCVTVKNSNHFGAAALFARRATEAGMIGLATTTVIPNMAVRGGLKPVAGNNPIAFAAPITDEKPFVMDLSLSQVAGGKLLLAKEKGEAIPPDWAVDKNGNPTTDPVAGFAGYLLPMGGHKGFALSLVVDVLAGVLSGSLFSMRMKSMYANPDEPSGTGHFMLAINPEALMEREEWNARMRELRQNVKASPMAPGYGEMLFPGEIEERCAAERAVKGIPLPRKLFTDLEELAVKHGVAARLRSL